MVLLRRPYCNSCEYPDFIETSCGHIATGDLSIISDKKLESLLSKGPGYREPSSVNLDNILSSITADINTFIRKWSEKEKLAVQVFSAWRCSVLKLVRDRLETMSNRYYFPGYQSVFSNPASATCLEYLQDSFVLVPVDKASKNIALICKRFYMTTLLEELDSNTDTYACAPGDYNCLSKTHGDYIRTLNLAPPCDKIPYTYWTPKFHKPTLSQRFIVSYADCSIKPLAQKLSLALRCVLKQIESFGKMLFSCTGVRHSWIINNSIPIVDYLKSINQRSSARNITTYDFSPLYTKLSHSDILECMNEVIDLAFKKSKSKFISVYNKSSAWCNNPRSRTFSFSAVSLKDGLNFIVSHAYFSVGSKCYVQTIGIPIGVDCAPPMANLTLFKFEYDYISGLIRRDYGRALRYNGIFRLMDDITCTNNDGIFDEDIASIYPASLELKKENVGNMVANVLDLNISCISSSGLFIYKLFDKRDSFKFPIVNYPDLSGNIAAICGYGVVKSELKRYAKLSSNFSDFIARKCVLFDKLVVKGYTREKLDKIYHDIGL